METSPSQYAAAPLPSQPLLPPPATTSNDRIREMLGWRLCQQPGSPAR